MLANLMSLMAVAAALAAAGAIAAAVLAPPYLLWNSIRQSVTSMRSEPASPAESRRSNSRRAG